MRGKLNSLKGESLTETLVAILIIALVFGFMATAIVTSSRMNARVRTANAELSEQKSEMTVSISKEDYVEEQGEIKNEPTPEPEEEEEKEQEEKELEEEQKQEIIEIKEEEDQKIEDEKERQEEEERELEELEKLIITLTDQKSSLTTLQEKQKILEVSAAFYSPDLGPDYPYYYNVTKGVNVTQGVRRPITLVDRLEYDRLKREQKEVDKWLEVANDLGVKFNLQSGRTYPSASEIANEISRIDRELGIAKERLSYFEKVLGRVIDFMDIITGKRNLLAELKAKHAEEIRLMELAKAARIQQEKEANRDELEALKTGK